MKQSLTQEIIDQFLLDLDKNNELENYLLKDGESGLLLAPPNNDADVSRFRAAPTWYMDAIDEYHLINYLNIFGGRSPRRRVPIGIYPAMSLQQARTAYLAYLTDIRNEVTRKIQYELDKVKPTHIIDGQEYKQLELKE